MGKKIFGIYLAKLDLPNSEAHARLELPASPWELHDAMDKVQLQENEELYGRAGDPARPALSHPPSEPYRESGAW